MARQARADDFEDDPEGPDAWDAGDDADASDDAGTMDCAHCGREISAMAEQCPRCGTYVSEEDAPRSTFPRWVVVTAAVLAALMVWGMVRGIF